MVAPNRTLLRRRIRNGDPVEKFWAREVNYFHQQRQRDFNRLTEQYARLDSWNRRQSERTA